MVEHNAQSLQRLYMVQAIDLFHEAYAPYVLDTMRQHFGDRLLAHLRSLTKRTSAPIYVDIVDNQPRPDFLALIHLMTRDGGLRAQHSTYEPVLFAPQGSHMLDGLPVAVPSFKELRLIRLRRNALNHQGTLTGDMIIDSIERIMRMVDMLPLTYQAHERRIRLQLVLARAQSSEFAQQLQQLQIAQQERAHEHMHQALLHAQQSQIDQHAAQWQLVAQQVQSQQSDVQQAQVALHEVQTALNQLLVDQKALVRGTAESVVDVRNQIEARIAQIQQALAQFQLPQPVDPQIVHTIERLQRELAAQQQITADMRIELNRMHEQIDTLRSAPLSPSARIPWSVVILLVAAAALGGLWYSGWLMWGIWQLVPYIERIWPLQK